MKDIIELHFLDIIESDGMFFATLIKENDIEDFVFIEIDDPEATLAVVEKHRMENILDFEEDEEDIESNITTDIYYSYINSLLLLNFEIIDLKINSKDNATGIYDCLIIVENVVDNSKTEIKVRVSDLINLSIRTYLPIIAYSTIFNKKTKPTNSNAIQKLIPEKKDTETKIKEFEIILQEYVDSEEYENANIIKNKIKQLRQDY